MTTRTWAVAATVSAAAALSIIAPGMASAATPIDRAPAVASAPTATDAVYCTFRVNYRTELYKYNPASGHNTVIGYVDAGLTFTDLQQASAGFRNWAGHGWIYAGATSQIGSCFS